MLEAIHGEGFSVTLHLVARTLYLGPLVDNQHQLHQRLMCLVWMMVREL